MITTALERIAQLVTRHPRKILLVGLLLALGGALGAGWKLEFRAGRSQLIDPDQPYFRLYQQYSQSFAGDALLLVVIHIDDDPRQAAAAASWIASELRPMVGQELETVYARRGSKFLRSRAMLLAPKKDLRALEQALEQNSKMLRRWAAYPDLGALLADLSDRLAGPAEPGTDAAQGIAFLESLLASSEQMIGGRPYSPILAGMKPPAPGPLDPYFVSESGKLLFIYLQPRLSKSQLNIGAQAVSATRRILRQAQQRHPGLRLGLTGRPALDADEMFSTQQDMKRAFVLALVGVTLLFVFVFGSLRRPLMAVLTMLLAVAWTFGLATLYPGYLNLLSIVFALILIGLGIDFGIYLLSGYEVARQTAPTVEASISQALARVGPPMLGGALTTVIAFYTALLVDFRGVAELGLLAGTGVLFCLLAMLVLLPAMLMLGDRSPDSAARDIRAADRRSAGAWNPFPRSRRGCWVVLLLAVVLTIALVPGMRRVGFSYNPRKLLAAGLESVAYEQVVQQQSGQSTWFGVVIAPSREALREKVHKLRQLPEVKHVRSVDDIWPIDDKRRRARLARLARLLPPLARREARPDASRCSRLYARLGEGFEQAADDLFLDRPKLAGRMLQLAQTCQRIVLALGKQAPATAARRLAALQAALFVEVDDTLKQLRALVRPPAIRAEDLPLFYRRLFVSADGRSFAAHVYPAEDITKKAPMVRYMRACLAVDAKFTGPPMLFFRTSRLMRHGFERVSYYALLASLVVLVITLRGPLSILLAATPLALGLAWTVGAMGYLGMSFDLANCFGVPILLGIGIDVGIHLVHAFRASGKVDEIWAVTGRAVTVTTLTTMIGFGSMLVARHRGLAGLGKLVCLGMCGVLLASVVVLPAIFRLLEREPEQSC